MPKVGKRQNAVDSSQHTEDRKQNDQKRLSLAAAYANKLRRAKEALRTQRVEVKDSMLKTEVRATERERSEVRIGHWNNGIM